MPRVPKENVLALYNKLKKIDENAWQNTCLGCPTYVITWTFILFSPPTPLIFKSATTWLVVYGVLAQTTLPVESPSIKFEQCYYLI